MRLSLHTDGIEKHLSLGIEKINRELERMRIDLSESIDQKNEQMVSRYNSEIINIKEKYQDATKNVKQAGNEIATMFVEKVAKIKETCSSYFVNTDLRLDEFTKENL